LINGKKTELNRIERIIEYIKKISDLKKEISEIEWGDYFTPVQNKNSDGMKRLSHI
jgi:hypothetical protein